MPMLFAEESPSLAALLIRCELTPRDDRLDWVKSASSLTSGPTRLTQLNLQPA